MKMFKKVFSVFLGATFIFGATAMSACNLATGSGTAPTSDELITAAADTFDKLYLSETGYNITADMDLDLTMWGYTSSAQLDISAAIINDDGLKVDAVVSTTSTDIEATTYTYMEMLMRDDYVYTKEISDNNPITSTDGLYTGARVIDEIDTTFDSYTESILSTFSEDCGDLLMKVLGNFSSSASLTADGFALTFDIVEELNYFCTNLSALAVYLQTSTTELTLGDVLNSEAVKTLCDRYFDGVTGADMYSFATCITELSYMLSSEEYGITMEEYYIPEGTESQTALDYIIYVCRENEIYDEPLADISETVTGLISIVTAMQTVLTDSTITITLNFNGSKMLSGLDIVIADLAISSIEIDLTLSLKITEGNVVLKETPQEYAVGDGFAYSYSGESSMYLYFTNTNKAYIYIDDEYSGDYATYTVDESGEVETITIDGETYTYVDWETTVTYNDVEYKILSVYIY